MKKIFFVIALSFIFIGCSEISIDDSINISQNVIERLSKFTILSESDEKKSFLYENELGISWELIYSKENDFIKFFDNQTINLLDDYGFKKSDFVSDCSYSYDISDKEFRIYFDEDTVGFSILNYSIDNDEFLIQKDFEWYYLSDSFAKFINDHDIANRLKEALVEFENIINENGIDINDIYLLD